MSDEFPLIILSNERYIYTPLRRTLHGKNAFSAKHQTL